MSQMKGNHLRNAPSRHQGNDAMVRLGIYGDVFLSDVEDVTAGASDAGTKSSRVDYARAA